MDAILNGIDLSLLLLLLLVELERGSLNLHEIALVARRVPNMLQRFKEEEEKEGGSSWLQAFGPRVGRGDEDRKEDK